MKIIGNIPTDLTVLQF